jgi:hypothetical protein
MRGTIRWRRQLQLVEMETLVTLAIAMLAALVTVAIFGQRIALGVATVIQTLSRIAR